MDTLLLLTFVAVAIVLLFDYTNGFHDAANIVATVIASRAMQPAQAVLIIGVFEFLGPLLGGTAVANTIGKFVQLDDLPKVMSLTVLVSGLGGAIVWNLMTWWKGIPSSSSHALVGGLIGAVVLGRGRGPRGLGLHRTLHTGHVHRGHQGPAGPDPLAGDRLLVGLWPAPLVQPRLAAPPFRGSTPRCAGPILSLPPAWPSPTAPTMPRRAWAYSPWSCCWAATSISFKVPFWVMLACATAMTLGILSGGWRIVRTLGFAIYKVRPDARAEFANSPPPR
jgi:PiT family inorganic phosphate transporter